MGPMALNLARVIYGNDYRWSFRRAITRIHGSRKRSSTDDFSVCVNRRKLSAQIQALRRRLIGGHGLLL